MEHKRVLELTLALKNEITCQEPVLAAIENRPTARPDPNQEAAVLCSVKIKQGLGENEIFCTVYDKSSCPLSHAYERLVGLL